ncbi:MAG TPA: MFS transporter [Xanthobacteraceae bacterium]|nr:MFS transporter [Xanthobacteraceae bacterium]
MPASIISAAALPEKTPTRSIILLAVAGFASQAQVRVMDSLLPQIAADLHTTVGDAAMVVTAYAVTHGSIQLVIGPVGDRFGKYRTVALMCAIGAILVAVCGMVSTLPQLALARLATGAAGGWIIPISMAYVGDVTPRDRLQPILARYLTGQILGQLFGQAAGGVLGNYLGWRNVFFVLAGMFAIASIGLVIELAVNPVTRKTTGRGTGARGFVGEYAAVLSNPFARIVLIASFFEFALMWGAFAYIGAYLHLRFGLNFALVGVAVGCFGIGGLFYAGLVKVLVGGLGQIGVAITGAFVLALAYVGLAVTPAWWLAPMATTAIGLGFYMLHNTLQTTATLMTPEARGTAVALFSSALYLGQTAGVTAGAPVVDRFGAAPLFLTAAAALPILAIWFGGKLKRNRRVEGPAGNLR